MATVFDVAVYILNKTGPITAMKLQKLVYYSQAWSLVWDDDALFEERIEAWANGPVVPALYAAHKGLYKVSASNFKGNPDALNEAQKETVDVIINGFGDKSSQWLSDLSHTEDPWKDARKNIEPGERGCAVISHAAMMEYYGAIDASV